MCVVICTGTYVLIKLPVSSLIICFLDTILQTIMFSYLIYFLDIMFFEFKICYFQMNLRNKF